jgi:hypothetical protein
MDSEAALSEITRALGRHEIRQRSDAIEWS